MKQLAVVIIPARYQSSRFPGKPLAMLMGRPMILHVLEKAKKVKNVSEVIVATDDKRILGVVESFGYKAMMTSNAHLSGTARVAEVARKIDAQIVVNVQGDEPLIDPYDIQTMLDLMQEDPKQKIVTLAAQIRDQQEAKDPNVVKVVFDQQGFAMYFSRSCIPFVKQENVTQTKIYKHLGVYAFQKEFLLQMTKMEPTRLEQAESLEQLRWLEAGIPVKIIQSQHDSVGVDTPEQLVKVHRLLEMKK